MARRRILTAILFGGLLLGAATAHAQEAAKTEAVESDPNFLWKVANFLLFAGGMGFLIMKLAPSFFNARSSDIQRAIQDATGLKLDADLRYSEIDRKMATLSNELARLRDENRGEMEREYQRLQTQTNDEIAYIRRNTAAEIEALTAEGATQLRLHATQQAFAQAEARLRQRYQAEGGQDLLSDFLRLVERGQN